MYDSAETHTHLYIFFHIIWCLSMQLLDLNESYYYLMGPFLFIYFCLPLSSNLCSIITSEVFLQLTQFMDKFQTFSAFMVLTNSLRNLKQERKSAKA